MNVRSPITWLLLLGFFTTGIFIACHKEVNQPKKEEAVRTTFTVKEARKHFYKQVRPAMTLRQQRQQPGKNLGKLYPIWDKAQTHDAGDYQLVEVPAFYEKKQLMAIRMAPAGDTISRTAPPSKEELGNFDRLVIYKFNDGTMMEKIVTYMPDAGYMGRHQHDASHNKLWELDKDFSGYLVHRSLEGEPVMALKMKNGKIASYLDYAKAARKQKENAKWIETCTTKYVSIGWMTVCVTRIKDEPGQGMIIYEECQGLEVFEEVINCWTTWEDDKPDCWQTPDAPGCPQPPPVGGGTPPTPCGGDNPPCPTTGNPPQPDGVIVPMAADPILDISVYLGVFDYTKPVKVIIRTSQPVPGTREVFNGADLGHTFITFEQNRSFGLVRRTIGAHPTEPLSLTMPVSPVQLGNDQSYGSNVQLEATISGAKFGEVYQAINYFSQGNFEIRGTNAHYLGYQVAYVAGFGVPETMGTLAGLPAWNAGDFGEDMKAAGGVAVPGYPLPNLN